MTIMIPFKKGSLHLAITKRIYAKWGNRNNMENFEIVFIDVPNIHFGKILKEHFQLNEADIVSSHFFDSHQDKTLTYSDISDWSAYFSKSGTCDIFVRKILIGAELKNVVLLYSHNTDLGDITINFEEEQLKKLNRTDLESCLRKLLQRLLEIGKIFGISKIILGYEPAEDSDMELVEICNGNLRIMNEKCFSSTEVSVLHQVAVELIKSVS